MPTYDYECQSCGHTTEVFQSISEDPITTCPQCGEDELKRLISAGVGIIFKGSGFYVTDSKKGSSTKSGASEAKSDSTSDSAKETKSESKSSKSEESGGTKKADTAGSAKAS